MGPWQPVCILSNRSQRFKKDFFLGVRVEYPLVEWLEISCIASISQTVRRTFLIVTDVSWAAQEVRAFHKFAIICLEMHFLNFLINFSVLQSIFWYLVDFNSSLKSWLCTDEIVKGTFYHFLLLDQKVKLYLWKLSCGGFYLFYARPWGRISGKT